MVWRGTNRVPEDRVLNHAYTYFRSWSSDSLVDSGSVTVKHVIDGIASGAVGPNGSRLRPYNGWLKSSLPELALH